MSSYLLLALVGAVLYIVSLVIRIAVYESNKLIANVMLAVGVVAITAVGLGLFVELILIMIDNGTITVTRISD